MNHSGQASMEFVLVLVFMLVIVAAIVLPLGQTLQYALEDVSVTGHISSGINRIESSVSTMTIIPGNSRQDLDFFLPGNTRVLCNSVDNNVGFYFELKTSVFDASGAVPAGCTENGIGSVPAMSCVKYYVFPPSADLRCQGSATDEFVLESGQTGFSQNFRLGSKYAPGIPNVPSYTIDLNVV